MNLKKRYKSNTIKKVLRFILLNSFFISALLLLSTTARNITTIEGRSKAIVANWNIKVNDNIIESEQEISNFIKLIPEQDVANTMNNKLAPGQKGRFDIIINPAGTQVAIEYRADLVMKNTPKGIKLTKYEIIEDNIKENLSNNTIIGEIELPQQAEQLTEDDKKTIRVYWEWDENIIEMPAQESSSICTTITIKQKIS